jgi:hypothetical protein
MFSGINSMTSSRLRDILNILNTRNTAIYYLIVSSLLFVAFSTDCYGASLCTGRDATLDCLKKHSFELYSENYELFWKILNDAARKANTCKSKQDTAAFLNLVQITRDGELAEFFSENLENLCVSNTKCFFDALLLLEPFDQDRLIYELHNPFSKKTSEITEAFNKYKDNGKYKRVIDLYFQRLKPADNLKTK